MAITEKEKMKTLSEALSTYVDELQKEIHRFGTALDTYCQTVNHDDLSVILNNGIIDVLEGISSGNGGESEIINKVFQLKNRINADKKAFFQWEDD